MIINAQMLAQCAQMCQDIYDKLPENAAQCLLDNADKIRAMGYGCASWMFRLEMYGGCSEPVSECIPPEVMAEIGPTVEVVNQVAFGVMMVGLTAAFAKTVYDYYAAPKQTIITSTAGNPTANQQQHQEQHQHQHQQQQQQQQPQQNKKL